MSKKDSASMLVRMSKEDRASMLASIEKITTRHIAEMDAFLEAGCADREGAFHRIAAIAAILRDVRRTYERIEAGAA